MTRKKVNKTEEMIKNLEMLDSLFEHANEGIIVANREGVIVKANPKTLELFNYSVEELIGKKVEILIPSDLRSRHIKHREGYEKKPSNRPMGKGLELSGLRSDGSIFPLEISLSHFQTSEGWHAMGFIVDITERKKREEELVRAKEEILNQAEALTRLNNELELKVRERTHELAVAIEKLAESKKEVLSALEKEKELNELKSRFVTTASHEFRTPLGTILSSASLIGRYNESADDDKRQKHIDRIKSAVSNLTEILNDFLSIDKLEEGIIRNNPVEFEIDPFINTLIEELKTIVKKGQTLNYTHNGNIGSVVLDNQLFRNVLINLVSNAIKYSEENGEITVDIREKKDHITLKVKDNGIGIPKDDQAHIFQRFFRAQNASNIQGTGLGLNIVKKYVELMGGSIGFESESGKGTIFTVTLPKKPE